jgi:hypothetical protein
VRLGSFTVDGKQIEVERGWSHFDGIVYRLIDAKTRKEIAVSRHRGLDLVEDGDQDALAAGLRTVLGLPS